MKYFKKVAIEHGYVFDLLAATIDGKTVSFGVSGLLYQSDVLMYDRETESLWSQLKMQAVSGPQVKTKLVWIPSKQLTWEAWKKKNPAGEVLSTDTGFRRKYSRTMYAGYAQNDQTMFPVPHHRTELRNKEPVAGIVINGKAAAYLLRRLKSRAQVEETVGGLKIRIKYDDKTKSVEVINVGTGRNIPVVTAYWFAWQAFYPETTLWKK